jgi:hypothetical protein
MAKVCKSDGQGSFAGTQGNGELAPEADNQYQQDCAAEVDP